MFKILLELFFLYLLYKLIFDFIIPVYQTTKQVKQKVNKMQQDINERLNQQQNNATKNSAGTKSTGSAASKKDDYIEFEEVK